MEDRKKLTSWSTDNFICAAAVRQAANISTTTLRRISVLPFYRSQRSGPEQAERGESRAPINRLWPISHFDPVRTCLRHHAAQKSIGFVNGSGPAIHSCLPTGEKGIGVNHHPAALQIGFEQNSAGSMRTQRNRLWFLAFLE